MNGQDNDHRLPSYDYTTSKNEDDYNCAFECTCKYTGASNRSSFDMMQYQHYVLGKPLPSLDTPVDPSSDKRKYMATYRYG